MKRIFSFVACVCMLVTATMGVACKESNTDNGDPQVAVTAVSLNKTAVKLNPEATAQLTAMVAPENATNKAVAWTSSKEEVATVSDAGLVTAVAEGEATITVTTEDGAKTASCKVVVEALEVSAESISLNFTELTLSPGDEETLVATVMPEAVENKDVKFRSSNSDVASVGRSTGVISAKTNGEATITVTSYDNEEVTATCNVVVRTPVESISLSSEKLVLIPGAKEALVATILPATASDKSVEWKSSNEAVATVENGEVTAVAEGEATITATTDNGAKTATCAVEVKAVDNENPLKVISFNITVSQNDGENSWSARRGAIINFINAEKPDVMGMQEITAHQLNYLTSKLSDYAEYGVDRGNSQSPGSNAGERTSILYNKQTVEVLDKGTFWLSDTPEVSSRSWNDTGSTGYAADAMKYHRTCTWMKFKRKADGKVFFYYNTHLEFGYHANYNLGQNAREKGIALIVERMKAKAANGEAVIFGGDMNQVANDRCFNPLFNNGWVSGRATATEVISEANQYSITFNNYETTVREQQENNKGKNAFHMIDHFFLKNCNAVEFRTIRDTNYGGEMKGSDNGSYMADHYPILITVAM